MILFHQFFIFMTKNSQCCFTTTFFSDCEQSRETSDIKPLTFYWELPDLIFRASLRSAVLKIQRWLICSRWLALQTLAFNSIAITVQDWMRKETAAVWQPSYCGTLLPATVAIDELQESGLSPFSTNKYSRERAKLVLQQCEYYRIMCTHFRVFSTKWEFFQNMSRRMWLLWKNEKEKKLFHLHLCVSFFIFTTNH